MEEVELINVVDDNDCVIAIMSRKEANAKELNVRIAAVLVFNSHGEVLLSRNAASKNYNPLKWGYSAAGHLSSEENYSSAAMRELEEELGIRADKLEYLGKTYNKNPGKGGAFCHIYKTIHEGPFTPLAEEISEIRYFKLDELRAEIETNPQNFSNNMLKGLRGVLFRD